MEGQAYPYLERHETVELKKMQGPVIKEWGWQILPAPLVKREGSALIGILT
jgi:hypothetical protein